MGYNAKEVYGGTRLRAEDLEGKAPAVLTITDIELAEFVDKETNRPKKMLELKFAGTDKSLLLNFSNASYVSDLYGSDTDAWLGKKIVVYHERVMFGTKLVGALRVRSVEAELQVRAMLKAHAERAAGNQLGTGGYEAQLPDTDPFGAHGPDVISRSAAMMPKRPREEYRAMPSQMPPLEDDPNSDIPF